MSTAIVFLAVAQALSLSSADASPSHAGKLRPNLRVALEQASTTELVPVSIVLADQLTGRRLQAAVPTALRRAAHRRAVVEALKAHAAAEQAGLIAELEQAKAAGMADRILPLWIGNVVGAELTPAWVHRVAQRPEVAWINHDPPVNVLPARESPPTYGGLRAPGGEEIDCGVELMQAPRVWNEMFITGDDSTVAVIDTGVCYTHSDIYSQIWVNPGEDLDGDGVVMDPDDENGIDDDANGFVDDLIGWNFEDDDNDPGPQGHVYPYHGSHVAGTVAGDGTGGTRAGMAPDASVMVLAVSDHTTEVKVWSAMQYAADNAADVISMSLGWPASSNPDRATWRSHCENTIDAGTAMVVAAGNSGEGDEPYNLGTPGDVPRVITVGATDCNDEIAEYSSRGPVTWEDVPPWNDHPYPPGLTKPDVSATGPDTKSHATCSGYFLMGGTSAATPHVSGAVALLLSANPELSHDDLKLILEDTSLDLGDLGKDNTFGSGRADAYEALVRAGSSRNGVVRVDRAEYSCADAIGITVVDGDLAGSGTLFVDVTSTTESTPEPVVLAEVHAGLGVYLGTIPTATGSAMTDGVLQVAHADVIDVRYTDGDDGAGGTDVEKHEQAVADCLGPVISSVRVTDIDDDSAILRWTTEEASTSDAAHDISRPPQNPASTVGLATEHAVTLTGLPECTIIFFEVASTDIAGNSTTDDNGGAYYRLESWGDFPGSGIVPCHAGHVDLDAGIYSCLDAVTVTVTDIGPNADTDIADTTEVTLTSTTETEPELLVLTETGPNTSRFQGTIAIDDGLPAPEGLLQASDGDLITATYRDDDDGNDSPAVVIASAVADCAGPAIHDLHLEALTQSRVAVVWTTAEPATSRADFGPTPGLGFFEEDAAFEQSHRLDLSPFEACGLNWLRVTSTDALGNASTAGANGGPLAFNAWEIPGLFWYDGFETDKGWTFTGEWERGSPQGLGAPVGHPDPDEAWAGDNVIGVDLSGQGAWPGDYEPDDSGSAMSPLLDATGRQNLELLFRRQLAVDGDDSASIRIKEGLWLLVWQNPVWPTADGIYVLQSYDISGWADDNPALVLSFDYASDGTTQRAGWTVDELIIKDGSLPDFDACRDCAGMPAFGGLLSAEDIDACAPGGTRLEWESAAAWGTGAGGSYNVYRDSVAEFEPGPATLLASGLSATEYEDTTAPDGVESFYIVRAETSESCSVGPANGGVEDGNLVEHSASDETSQPLPAEIDTLILGEVNDAHVRLEWQAAAGAASYRIYRSGSPDMSGSVLLEEQTGLFYEDAGEMLTTATHFYLVASTNACGLE